ncbi:PROTEIN DETOXIFICATION 44 CHLOROPLASTIC-RELATED [Salix viminalis]|uniref:PROTEIN DETOXIFICATION 44 CHLOROPLASTIC-RELATED n=1 Tax=Salix viminalis TaxID=40686 RepID=A0A9Q0QJZ4_SALVM|nr:PROTEIN DETOXIFICATION 44 CHLOROPLASTIC-RELATED [Salix viminalis]
MPEFLYGTERSSEKARMLLKSLVIIGAILGVLLASVGPFIAWRFPYIFTSDLKVIQEMHKVLILFFAALFVTPCTHSLEGTLLAGRDLKYTCSNLYALIFPSNCFCWQLVSSRGYGLPGCWCALGAFQWARFFLALQRLLSPEGILNSDPAVLYKPEEVKAA